MKILFIYDQTARADEFGSSVFNKGDKVYLFPLTSKSYITDIIIAKIEDSGCDFEILQTSQLINSAAGRIRDRYISFIAELPYKIKRKNGNLKDFFAIDKYSSLWWYSLISEKNTLKSDTINRLFQLDAIINAIKSIFPEKIVCYGKSEKLESALLEYASKNLLPITLLPFNLILGLKRHIFRIRAIVYLRHVLGLFDFAIHLCARVLRIKICIGPLKRNLDFHKKPLFLITPYPNFDILSAQKGKFKNKFYPCLQEALEDDNQSVIWVANYVDNNSISFKDSLKLARNFIASGNMIFFLEEFSSIGAQIRSFLTMLLSGLKYLSIEKQIYREHSFGDYNFYAILRDDWYLSFTGITGYTGLLYYRMFKALLNKIKAEKCLYLCEMHAWEKALINARDAMGITMPLYGYQSGTIGRMTLNYFNHLNEIIDDSAYSMPCPDKVVCNGQKPYNCMKESGWSKERLYIAEAIRYNHLKRCLSERNSRKKNIVLLAFSISAEESSSMLNVVCEGVKGLKNIEFWMKAHPFLDLKNVFKLSGLSRDIDFKIKTEPIEDLLVDAKMVIVGQSGVSMHALLYGCQVLSVYMPEWINMSPLNGIKHEQIRFIYSPEELRQAVVNCFEKKDDNGEYLRSARNIVSKYLCLDEDSDVPHRFLKLLRCAEI